MVDDEQRLADLFTLWLEELGEVETAYDGEAALGTIDDSVDMVFLDRQMPGLNGDEVLTTLRDRGYSGYVTMVTAVDPDMDILDLGFDDYLLKPADKDELHTKVEHYKTRSDYTEKLRRYFALSTKLALLETHKSEDELTDYDEYEHVQSELQDIQESLQLVTDDFTPDEFEHAYADL